MALPLGGRGGAEIPRRAFVDELCERADRRLVDLDALPFPRSQLRKLRRTIEYRRRLLRGSPV